MKKILTLLMVFAISVISITSVCFAAEDGYGPVTVPTDGKEYVLVWNKNWNDNLGDNYAITAGANGISATKITVDDLASGAVDSKCVWILEELSDGVWAVRNEETGEYLRYDASASAKTDKITVAPSKQDDGSTDWKITLGSVSNQFSPANDTSMKLRYSGGNANFAMQNENNSSWVWMYEKGEEVCQNHTYSSCTDTVCTNCGAKTRVSSGLSHTYSSNDDTECDVCGFVRDLSADGAYGVVLSPTDGREYVILWNENWSDNLGKNYTITANEKGISSSAITADDLEAGVIDSKCLWILQEPSKGVWTIRNSETGEYLRYDASASDKAKMITLAPSMQDDGSTNWILKSGTISNQFLAANNTDMRLRYSVGSAKFVMQDENNNSWIWLYEKGVMMCQDHTYSSCTSTVCDNCGAKTRASTGLSHTYSSDDDAECDVCGHVRHLFAEIDVNENTAVRTFTATFSENGYDSIANDNCKNQFDLTSMVASIAPLEDVTHVEITVESSNVEKFDNPNNASPTCQLFWNGWWKEHVATKKFGSDGTVTFSADVDPEFVESIWLLPFAFTPETEISFRISVEVTYGESKAFIDYGEPLVSIVSFSDYQLHGSDGGHNNGEAIRKQVTDIFNTMNKVKADYFIFGGDYGCGFATDSSNYSRAEVIKLISDKWSNISPDKGTYIQVEGNHDNAEVDGFTPTGGYEYDEFIVYLLNEDDMPWSMYSASDKSVCESTAKKMTEYFNKLIDAGETRPVIIASHTGLHYDAARNDGNNQYAYIIFDAINEAAKNLDIIFMFGHNHSTGDPEIGGSLAFKTVGDTIYVSDEDCYDSTGNGYRDRLNIGRAEELNFTYMTYGYVGYVGARLNDNEAYDSLNPSTVLTASELKVYDDKITVTVYSAGGRMSSFAQVINRNAAGAASNAADDEQITPNVDADPTESNNPTEPNVDANKPAPGNRESGSSAGVYILVVVIVVIAVAVAAAVVIVAKKKKTK